MSPTSLCQLLALSAIWGASFLLLRIAAPVLGAVVMIESRVVMAALFLWGVSLVLRSPLNLRAHGRHYLMLGLFNSALPFLLFGVAAQTLSASLLSILNATTPLWGALIGALYSRTRLTAKASLGLVLGICGVAILAGFDTSMVKAGAPAAIAAALGAACSYGIASTYAKSTSAAQGITPLANAHGTMWAATLLIAPATPFFPVTTLPGGGVIAAVVTLGVVCSGIAYLLYFRLIDDLGATSALTVTFLIPVFGIFWGWLFLNEAVGWHTLVGATVVMVGTALVTGFSLPGWWRTTQQKTLPTD
ncbi:MAG: DMT family transporter [Betaproteobacteria bacterium]|nr:DMT family transporter [Betaproteobacteria bacterium]